VRIDRKLGQVTISGLPISFQRVRRDISQTASLGISLIHRVRDHTRKIPKEWKQSDAIFLPIPDEEAVWIAFDPGKTKPKAVQIKFGAINAVSGRNWKEKLEDLPQNYVVCPPQLWMEGTYSEGRLVERLHHLSKPFELMEIVIYQLKPNRVPKKVQPTSRSHSYIDVQQGFIDTSEKRVIRRGIAHDPFGLEAWNTKTPSTLAVYLTSASLYYQITGSNPPTTPADADIYTGFRLP
jgi:hypothetical protein